MEIVDISDCLKINKMKNGWSYTKLFTADVCDDLSCYPIVVYYHSIITVVVNDLFLRLLFRMVIIHHKYRL
jgi:hypothetical protein